MVLTVRKLESLKPNQWASNEAAKGSGRLAARGLKNGDVAFYYRYTKPDGKRDAIALGRFSARQAKGRLTLLEALELADTLSKRYRSGDKDLRSALEADAHEREQQWREAKKQAELNEKRASFGTLLEAYCDQLDAARKPSAPKVRGTVYRHIRDACPTLWEMKADELDVDDLIPPVAQLHHDGKIREAEKLRSYIRSAYSYAVRARQSPTAPLAVRQMNIRHNPAAALAPVETNRDATSQRALSLTELQTYWSHISRLSPPHGALLQFHLLTGAQRLTQLSRLTARDYDEDSAIITLHDLKGRRRQARPHDIPLISAATDALHAMQGGSFGDFLFTVTAGKSGASYEVAQKHIKAICATMAQRGELEQGPFTANDIRRTVETRLAAAGVPPHIRAQLQSHGISGVQIKHYDRYDYLDEKRHALEKLYQLVTSRK